MKLIREILRRVTRHTENDKGFLMLDSLLALVILVFAGTILISGMMVSNKQGTIHITKLNLNNLVYEIVNNIEGGGVVKEIDGVKYICGVSEDVQDEYRVICSVEVGGLNYDLSRVVYKKSLEGL